STPYGAEWVRFQVMRESCPSQRTLACWIRLNSLLSRLGAPPVHPFGGAGIPGWGEPGIARSRDGRGPMSWDRPVPAWAGGGRNNPSQEYGKDQPGDPSLQGAPPPFNPGRPVRPGLDQDRKSTRLNSSHVKISYA